MSRYIQFHDGPHQGELRALNGREVTFVGTVTEGPARNEVNRDVAVKLRIRESMIVYSIKGSKLYQVTAVAVGDSLFRKNEPVTFEYDALSQESEEIYLL